MTSFDLFDDDSDDTREAIMRATYRALCAHGYADLTIQRIGDEFPKSKSLIYHHYEGKDELLGDFLAYLLDHFETSVPRRDYENAAEHLRAVIEYTLPDDLDEERREFTGAMIELRSQAANDPAYREHFTRSSEVFHDRLAAIVEQGIEEGVFREVDPDRIASVLLAIFHGARLQRITVEGDPETANVKAELDQYLRDRLFCNGVPDEHAEDTPDEHAEDTSGEHAEDTSGEHAGRNLAE